MTEREFLLGGRFAERAAEGRAEKKRVVTEAARSAGLVDNGAFHRTAIHVDPPFLHKRDRAYESRDAVRNAAQFLQQQTVVRIVGGAWPGEARRIDAGRSAERIHLESGIVREQRAGSVRRVVQRFLDGVL